MKKIIAFVLAIAISALSFAQGDQFAIQTKINDNQSQQALLHLPDDYNSTPSGKRYPMIVFAPGYGEGIGNDLSLIYNNAVAGGPAYWIAQGNPMHFTNPKTGLLEKFIVVSVQSTQQGGTTSAQMPFILADLVAKYPKIDVGRITLMAISQGGHPTSEYAGGFAGTPAYNIAAYIPMSAALTAWMTETQADYMFTRGTAIWGFGGKTPAGVWDTHGANTGALVYQYNQNTGAKGKMTEYICDPSHWCWGTYTNPSYSEWVADASRPGGGDNLSIYTWALLQGTSAAVVSFSVDAGLNQVIQLPVNSVVLSGTAVAESGKTITNYTWSKTSGPGTTTILNPNNQEVTASGLQAGTYVFNLLVTQSDGAQLSSTVQVIVNAPAVIPFRRISTKRPIMVIKMGNP